MKIKDPFISMYKFTEHEKKIVEAIWKAGGKIFRTDLRGEIGGSNTTFIRKVLALKNKGIIEEFKERDSNNGRLKTVYAFTEYASRMLDLKGKINNKGWFTASQKIWLLPEFVNVSKKIFKDNCRVYEELGIGERQMYLEALFASNKKPDIDESGFREVLTLCSAFLQDIVANKLKHFAGGDVEGYIIFRYKFEEVTEQQKIFSNYVIRYLEAEDPIQQHRILSKIVELVIVNPSIISNLALSTLIIAHSMKWENDLREVTRRYREYMAGKEPLQLTRIEFIISVLNILKKLYLLKQRLTSSGD